MSPLNQNSQKPHNDQKGKLNSYVLFSGIAIQMVVIICVGTFSGVKLDDYYPNDHNLFTLCFSLGSVILSIIFVIRRIIAASKES
ncbi:AtpZ/AtpI family protein [uncultured Winogradskyella sp.]|uniref:AtpZ/AtpI family protein n=1 Tax=uncultured Winogradskyella sp. TaxID=395353 RepID=UPI0026080C57|nr:AtpZ/AtpI family protein [uncultured Winogradskyella sp.]